MTARKTDLAPRGELPYSRCRRPSFWATHAPIRMAQVTPAR
jgi:hypothetical protein